VGVLFYRFFYFLRAAFQFGVKMNDGRKTRRAAFDPKIEKAKIDKEWNQISQILEKRKTNEQSGLGNYKKPKY
jgi:IK cytokine